MHDPTRICNLQRDSIQYTANPMPVIYENTFDLVEYIRTTLI